MSGSGGDGEDREEKNDLANNVARVIEVGEYDGEVVNAYMSKIRCGLR